MCWGDDLAPLVVHKRGVRYVTLHRHTSVILALVVIRCQSALPAPEVHNHQTLDLAVVKKNWKSVWYLYLSSALRYCVNTALVYLFVRWAE